MFVVLAIVTPTHTHTHTHHPHTHSHIPPHRHRPHHTHSQIYYVLGVIEDLVFRSLWTLDISLGNRGGFFLDSNILGTVFAILEVFRRFVWNFFRLENEHLNNAGAFRAVRDISIHPVDLSQMDLDDEAIIELGTPPPPRNKHRISNVSVCVWGGVCGQRVLTPLFTDFSF